MSKRSDKESTREELLAEIEHLRGGTDETARLVNELQIHQEELHAQQRELLTYQHELEDVRDAYAELFAFAPVAYIVIETSGVIREANLAASVLFGYERGTLTGRPLFLHVAPEERRTVLDHIARCRRGETHVATDVTVVSRSGASIPTQFSSSPALHKERELFLTTIVDLSERRRAEEERARALEIERQARQEEQLARAASQAKDRFIAVLSHELRTPLTPILLALEVIQRIGKLPDALAAPLDMIQRNVVLEAHLIDDLLDLSRIVQGKLNLMPELVDLDAVVRETLEMYASELEVAGVRAASDLRATAHHVRVDPVRLRQVLWNLMRNAIRHTPGGGEVRIVTENPSPERVALSVRDNGSGIDAGTLVRMFNFFEQGEDAGQREPGLGLGLPISKGIIEAHGGRITATSAGPYQGACLTIELPTVAAPLPVSEPRTVVHSSDGRSRRVLLVEDNEDSASALAELLRLSGYRVCVAHSMQQALTFLDEVDLVVSDIGLPDGSGHDLMRQICARRHVPGIALSGYGTSEDQRKSAEAGFVRHLVKPVEPNELLKVLQSLAS